MSATVKDVSHRLVEIGLLPANSGGVKMSSLPANLSKAIRQFAQGALMVVTEVTLPLTGLKTLRIEIREKNKTEVTYVLSCLNQ